MTRERVRERRGLESDRRRREREWRWEVFKRALLKKERRAWNLTRPPVRSVEGALAIFGVLALAFS